LATIQVQNNGQSNKNSFPSGDSPLAPFCRRCLALRPFSNWRRCYFHGCNYAALRGRIASSSIGAITFSCHPLSGRILNYRAAAGDELPTIPDTKIGQNVKSHYPV
jgi:hypothetical protein